MNRYKILLFATILLFSSTSVTATERISLDSNSLEGNNSSIRPAISADGQLVAFSSTATNLVVGDTNNVSDIFVHNRQTGGTERVSVGIGGVQANAASTIPSISADGRFVAFESTATNLVAGDTNSVSDIFVYDRQTGSIERVSVDNNGIEGNATSTISSISADGQFVAFESVANNLVIGDTNAVKDIFVRDLQHNTTKRVSVNSMGVQANSGSHTTSISENGRFIAFVSIASNLVVGDTNSEWDIFVHNRETGVTERVSVDNTGIEGNSFSSTPAISATGRFVVFSSDANNLIADDTNGVQDAFVHDRQTGKTERISVGSMGIQSNNFSTMPGISADGRFVTFASLASNLVADDTNSTRDVFIRDRQMDETKRASVDSTEIQGNNSSTRPSISADGRFVAFESTATNLVAGDTNNVSDVFIYTRLIKAAGAEAVPTMSASLLIVLIGLISGMALLMCKRVCF